MSGGPHSDGGAGGLSESKRKLLEQRLRGRGRASAPKEEGIPRQPEGEKRLASPGQRWIYIGQNSVPLSAGFNISSSFEVVGDLDVDLLERCAGKVLARHEVLRSNYHLEGDGLEQLVREDRVMPVERVSCRDREALLAEAQARVEQPFALETGRLARLHYFHCPGGAGLLVLVVHDIIFDKWSLGIFWKEISALYDAEVTGGVADLPELAIQFGDFAAWQRGRLEGGLTEKQLDYWRARLTDLPEPLPLPSDRPYPDRLTDAGRLERRRLSMEATKRIKEFAIGQDASLFMLLLLGFQVLLQRYTQTDDIVVGSPVANRRQKELADLIGFFLSTVAIRSRFENDPTVAGALAAVREAVLGALENQDVPFDRVVEAVNPPRAPGRHPLCQVMFVYQREHEATPAFKLEGVDLEHVFVETGTSKFDLTLFAAESGSGMEFVVEYRTDLFDEGTIARLLEHYEQLLESMVAHPAKKVSELEMLTPAERQSLFYDWQGKRLPPGETPGLLSSVGEHAAAFAESPAVTGSGGQLSWRELDARAWQCARRLQDLGVGVGDHVAHYMERTPEAIAGILGILRAGAAYVPIDPAYPVGRREFVMGDSSAVAVVLSAEFESTPGLPENRVVVPGSECGESPCEVPEGVSVEHDQPAYLIYTSGSTGEPKGVVVTHHNLLHSTCARIDYYQTPPRRFLLLSSFSFDSSVAGIFWTLVTGGTLVLPSAAEQRDPVRLVKLIADEGVTDLLCVPSLYRELLAAGGASLGSLSRVIVAGETCPPELVEAHYRVLPGVALYNEYGPTEATVWSTVHRCGEAGEEDPVPIGRPIPNTSAHVLDRKGRPLPVGVMGELYLGGEGVALGYHGRESSTNECFVECVLPELGAIRLYRTGDLARWRPQGVLEFVGRVDDQLKVNGYRIEPGEIESAMERHPRVDRAVVVPVPGSGSKTAGRQQLLAYYTTTGEGDELVGRDLWEFLADLVPSFLIPGSFEELEEIPLTPNGKVDRQLLARRDLPKADASAAPRTPAANPVEAQIMRIWDDFLDVRQIGREDNFFEMGGHSLLLPLLSERMRCDFGVEIPLGRIFEAPTVQGLAELVLSEEPANEWPCLVAIRAGGSRPPLFLVHGLGGEIGYYYNLADHLHPDQPVYGLQAPVEPFEEIPAMASHYLSEIRAVQPHGPYRLGGYCLGGCVAFEMARQLEEDGEQVEMLVLMDSVSPALIAPAANEVTLMRRIRRMASKGPAEVLSAVRRRARSTLGWGDGGQPGGTMTAPTAIPEAFRAISETHRGAMRRYEPVPIAGRAWVFRTEDDRFAEDLGWGGLLGGGLEIVHLDGPHSDVLKDPHLPASARPLRNRLDSLEEA